jgi:hypothetical protein
VSAVINIPIIEVKFNAIIVEIIPAKTMKSGMRTFVTE